MEDESSFGNWMRRRRKALDLTQQELAQRAGYATTTIRKIETDARRPSRMMAERLAEVLELSGDERAMFIEAAGATTPAWTIAERLAQLDALHAQGVISDAEHAAKRQQILDSV